MSQLLPLLDPSLVPKLESIKIAHLDFRQKAVVFESVPTTTTTTTTLATTTAMTPSHSATVWRPLLILPDRFAMKHLELPISNCHSELDSIVAFLKRCPDIERFTVPPVLLTIQTVVKLTELLVDWIHLKELIIVEFYLTDNGLAEVIRTACQGRRRRLNGWSSSFHQFQHLDAFNTKSLENAISDLSFATISEDDSMMGQGLESLRISQGFRSMPETSRAIIELHAATLVSVTLVNSRVVNRADLQLLLCSCPSLESLVALSDPSTMSGTSAWKIHDPFLSTGDMLRIAGPLPMTEVSLRKQRQEENGEFSAQTEKMEEWGWVCTRLRVLKLGFLPRQDDWSCETGFPYELAVQLGRMRYLEDLRLDRVQGITFGLHSFQDSFGTPSSVSTSMSMLGSPPTPTTTTTITPTTWSETETMTIAPISIFDTMDQPCELGHYDIGADEEARLRTESVTMALRILAKELRHLRRLELKGLKDYVDRDEIRKARRSWEHIEWIQYSRSSI
ncbi:hypothetical protein BGX31_004767 [Mortierella sp. GBA43]|nr:hypothetical protein BGX31_004767 [Mortierella sp. GBA43]